VTDRERLVAVDRRALDEGTATSHATTAVRRAGRAADLEASAAARRERFRREHERRASPSIRGRAARSGAVAERLGSPSA
jgi:hypothetical protein